MSNTNLALDTTFPLKIAVLCVSDNDLIAVLNASTKDLSEVTCCASHLAKRLREAGHELVALEAVPDDEEAIRAQVQAWIDAGNVDVVLTSDNTQARSGGAPPNVFLTKDNNDVHEFSTLLHDPALGFIGVVNIRSAQERAA